MSSRLKRTNFISTARVFSGVGACHSFFQRADGFLYAFGKNKYGQLGLGNRESKKEPTLVPYFMEKETIVKLASCGSSHSLFLTVNGDVYSCGINCFGQLGFGNKEDKRTPEKLIALDKKGVLELSCAGVRSYCLTNDGIVYAFGYNNRGELGTGKMEFTASPKQVAFPEGVKIVRICAGGYHAAAVAVDGTVWTWGNNRCGQIGRGGSIMNPGMVEGLPLVDEASTIQVICGGFSTTVLYSANEVYSFGINEEGQLGIGNTDDQHLPVRLEWCTQKGVQKMCLGGNHTIALTESGDVVAYGSNEDYQLCLGDKEHRNSPTKVRISSFSGARITDVVCGFDFSLYVTEEAACYAAGRGFSFGGGNNDSLKSPLLLLEGVVDVGGGDIFLNYELFEYIKNEQQSEIDEERTTDMCVWMRIGSERWPIRLNETMVVARRLNIVDGADIHVENAGEDTRDAILRLLYTDMPISRRQAEVLKDLLDARTITLEKSMQELYERKEVDGDVMITSDGGSHHKAHKFVLVARLSYFRSLFQGGWRESATGNVSLKMRLDETFEVFLRYVYTGERESGDSVDDERFNEYLDYFGHIN